ncbi:hypothetical protein TCAL_11937 [Tigriopus californicus]|uniref:TOG domain-containing protein n=1 Tax=Tigriopus californicus TaxID=6832 RepID=A0A553P3K4_TIGCA|nr:hypothetical protein TCAL_11937 [Tigriopus californicus]
MVTEHPPTSPHADSTAGPPGQPETPLEPVDAMARLKKLVQHLGQGQSRRERQAAFESVLAAWQRPDVVASVPENAVKALSRILPTVITRYSDSVSRHWSLNLARVLMRSHPEVAGPAMLTTLSELTGPWATLTPSTGGAKTALFALKWLETIHRGSPSGYLATDGGRQLLALESGLFVIILGSGCQRLAQSARHTLESTWQGVPLLEKDLESALTSAELSLGLLVLGSHALGWLHARQSGAVVRLKPRLLEALVKLVVSVKIKAHPKIVQLQKPFGTNLHAKDDDTRKDAAFATQCLAQGITDADALSTLLQTLFAVLGGSEGKLTVNSQKVSLLETAGGLSKNGVSTGNIQRPYLIAVESLTKVLETEVHDGTLIVTLENLALWLTRYPVEVPMPFFNWFPKGLELKSSTTGVRCSYLHTLSQGLQQQNSSASNVSALKPILMKVIKGAAKQPAQTNLLAEGIQAANCLIKILSGASESPETEEFWKLLLDHDKLLFTNDRFLLSANADVLHNLADVAQIVLSEKVMEMEGKEIPWIRALALAMMTNSGVARRHAQSKCRKLFAGLGGDKLASGLLNQITSWLEIVPVNSSSAKDGAEGTSSFKPKSIIECLTSIVGGCDLKAEPNKALDVAQSLLLPAHHPGVFELFPGLWVHLVPKLHLTPAQCVKDFQALLDLFSVHYLDGKNVESVQNMFTSLIKACPDQIVPDLVKTFGLKVKNPDLSISVEHLEIFKTPEGELFDQRIMESILADNDTKNVKRENKAYSYKEQLEEIALRKEIEEKRKREGTYVAPKLTSKQKDTLKTHLDKEAEIRKEVHVLKESVDYIMCIMKTCVSSNPKAFAGFISPLLASLFVAFKSPIIAADACEVLLALRRGVFESEDETLAQVIVALTIQIKNPSCPLPNSLASENVAVSARAVTAQIGESTVLSLAVEEDNACPFTCPAFAFAFPLMEYAIKKNMADEEFVAKGCAIMSEHAELRGVGDEASPCEPDDLHPKYLPRCGMLKLLLEIIASGADGRTQQVAVQCLIEVAQCASGKPGCAQPTSEEIQILLGALQMEQEAARDSGLRGLRAIVTAFPSNHDRLYSDILKRVWIARFDPVTENVQLADELWEVANFTIHSDLSAQVIENITHPVSCVRSSASEALAKLMEKGESDAAVIVTMLLDTYQDKLEMSPPIVDEFGRIVQKPVDHWEPRSGIAIALTRIAPFFDVSIVKNLINFLIPDALGDRNEKVRSDMLSAAKKTIELHGKDSVDHLLPVFEDFLKKAPSSEQYDDVRQAVVILMGLLAKHLEPTDPKVKPIVSHLILALKTPSQQVQMSVAECLPPLVPAIKEKAPECITNLINTLLREDVSYGERKGAAYGIAGLVKGLGILSLKQLEIMNKLTEAIQNKKSSSHREGALFAIEMLCTMLGRFFEPYIVHILKHLLVCFGDSVDHVRRAADDTAKAVMRNLSPHGVKLVLPSLLDALQEDKWRTKAGSVELLGAMAYCAPKQLSSCLPQIVPRLIEVLSDSHNLVTKSGVQALKQIGSVIRNPEIQAIVPILLRALQDPAKKTGPCLQTLLNTKFVHFIDAPSLALIMPVVQRAFQDRSTETRKMAAQIIGNMYSLTDQKDLSPYLPGIIPGLKNSLLDPVPEVRAVSARALGAMVKGMGESSFDELLPWLMSTLTSETSSVDRSGAAQGLSEVVGGLGKEKMEDLMPDIIATAARIDIAPHVKDGYIMMFIYMPTVFPEAFTQYIGEIISPILKALADENEFVRETAYKAGQRIVNLYADSAVTLLLPQLEEGLHDDNWRIRYSSVQLLGDLLYKISGVSGKMSTETAGDDDNFGTEQSQKIINEILGPERRNRVLAGLYMGRSDVALMVRQASLHVWKVIVSTTPKTLREILPTLFNLLLDSLASNSYDKRQIAARTLGDLVKKLGERVLPEIIPILERNLDSEEPGKRQGVCVGLSEIMVSTSREMVLTFVDSLVPTVRKALCDDLPEVREAAAKTFDSLHNTVGNRALDDILPPMLEQFDDPELHDNTLDGLRQVMAIKSRAVLPYLVPQLIAVPVNTKALANLAPVAGEALHRHLSRILPALLRSMAQNYGTLHEQREQDYAQIVILSISDEDSDLGVSIIMEELLGGCKSTDLSLKRSAATLMHAFCSETKVDYSQYVPQLIRALILLFTEDDSVVLNQAWLALSAVVKTLDVNEQTKHVADVRQAVRFALMDNKNKPTLAGFCLPKGIQPVLPIFRESILNGSPELKEQASMGLGEVIVVTSPEALKPSVVHITGPLIRILGDRFSAAVKVAVLDTLASLLDKAKDLLKPFFPQLQTTFMKALNDANRSVRLKAGIALSFLITIHMRPDPIFNELQNGVKNADDASLRDTYIQALRGCIEPAGERMSPPIRKGILQLLNSMLAQPEDVTRTCASGCLGAFCRWLPNDELQSVVEDNLLKDDSSLDWTLRHGRSILLYVTLKVAPDRVYTEANAPKMIKVILSYLSADRIPIAENAVRAIGYLFHFCLKSGQPIPTDLISPFCRAMNHASNDVKQLVPNVADFLAKAHPEILPKDILKPLLPTLVNGTKEKNSAVRSSSESALVSVMKMRKSNAGKAKCLEVLDSGAQVSLNEVIGKVLGKVASQPEGKEEVIDATILC